MATMQAMVNVVYFRFQRRITFFFPLLAKTQNNSGLLIFKQFALGFKF